MKALIATAEQEVLVLEWIDKAFPQPAYWEGLGKTLTVLHAHTRADCGFFATNYIGSLAQEKPLTKDWSAVFVAHRLAPLVYRCLEKNLLTKTEALQFEALYI